MIVVIYFMIVSIVSFTGAVYVGMWGIPRRGHRAQF